jgi:hypothetical protein
MEIRDRLRQALLLGTLARTDRLDECGAALAEILGTDSLDLVELIMASEEKGTKLDTVGDLMRFLDELKDD